VAQPTGTRQSCPDILISFPSFPTPHKSVSLLAARRLIRFLIHAGSPLRVHDIFEGRFVPYARTHHLFFSPTWPSQPNFSGFRFCQTRRSSFPPSPALSPRCVFFLVFEFQRYCCTLRPHGARLPPLVPPLTPSRLHFNTHCFGGGSPRLVLPFLPFPSPS